MYYPYFRGRRFELLAIRECAATLSKHEFVPIIEPVKNDSTDKKSLSSLDTCLEEIVAKSGKAIVISNPGKGDLVQEPGLIREKLNKYSGDTGVIPGILLTGKTSVEDIEVFLKEYEYKKIALIHAGYSNATELITEFEEKVFSNINIFMGKKQGSAYRKNFLGKDRDLIMLEDGFDRKPSNRDYALKDFFSDLHLTYEEDFKMTGFGDFLIVGDYFQESGGLPTTIAIHISFIDDNNDNSMYVYHFKSEFQSSRGSLPPKFFEALEKLLNKVDEGHLIYRSNAINEFQYLREQQHFPGLGHIKKLSMMHHIETLAHFKGNS